MAQSASPTSSPSQTPREGGLSFAEILPMLRQGLRLRRIAWEDPQVHIQMVEERLCITGMDADGLYHPLLAQAGDIFSDDWVEAG